MDGGEPTGEVAEGIFICSKFLSYCVCLDCYINLTFMSNLKMTVRLLLLRQRVVTVQWVLVLSVGGLL